MSGMNTIGAATDPAVTVSIVMPSLNQARFLEQAVRSVLEPALDGLELVVMDGASVDGSVALLTRLAAEFPGRLRWHSAPDDGPAQAVNRAVALATGPVIGWLNSDDLYEPGAIQRALDHLARAPDDVVVYGHATHVDAEGHELGAYPTQAPATPLAEFANGCFICQPSAFVRRSAWLAVGGLDETLRTAFDFDLWLKLFKAFPGRIGFVPVPQARSRLHADSITLRLRERVAFEGMSVVRRHLGVAPPHWLLTHFVELCEPHPFQPEPVDLAAAMNRLVDAAAPLLAADAVQLLRARIATDKPLRFATPNLFVAVHPDGWAGPVLEVRLRQPAQPLATIVLHCLHANPPGGRLRIAIVAPDAPPRSVEVRQPGPFEIALTVHDRRPGARLTFRIECPDGFVPAEREPAGGDRRRLAFLVEGCRGFRAKGRAAAAAS